MQISEYNQEQSGRLTPFLFEKITIDDPMSGVTMVGHRTRDLKPEVPKICESFSESKMLC